MYKALSLHPFMLQLYSSVKKMQGWDFVYLSSHFYHPYFVCVLFHQPYIVHVMLVYFGYENSLKTPDNHRHLQVKVVDRWVLGGAEAPPNFGICI